MGEVVVSRPEVADEHKSDLKQTSEGDAKSDVKQTSEGDALYRAGMESTVAQSAEPATQEHKSNVEKALQGGASDQEVSDPEPFNVLGVVGGVALLLITVYNLQGLTLV